MQLNVKSFRMQRLITVWALLVMPITMGLGARSVEAAPFAYVTSVFIENAVTAIDTADNMVVAKVPLNAIPTGLAVSPDAKRVYVGLPDVNVIAVIDTAANKIIDPPIAMTSDPSRIAVAPDGKHA